MICNNVSLTPEGHLAFAGVDTVMLAQKYGTPLYLMDENKTRENMRAYKKAMERYFPKGSVPEFASKAFSAKCIYKIAREEGIHIDVVSAGEIYTAKSADFPMENCFFHGNNKTDADIRFAIENGVGYFVVDNLDELNALNAIAAEMGVVQGTLLRVSPGIDPHTHKKVVTGSVDSKFGAAVETGQALQLTKKLLDCENISLAGFHCHIGSQIFESEPFITAGKIMLDFALQVEKELGFKAQMLNLGGGFGVRYTDSDPLIDYDVKLCEISKALNCYCEKAGICLPKIMLEPGRSIIADAGMTLYTVGSVKEITGYKNYVSVDGGMADNPRFALYESLYTVEIANRMNEPKGFVASIAGRCCESGDMLAENVKMPKPERGDILAVLTTGAYNYSMASNYNRLGKPPIVMLKDTADRIVVKRETLEDVCRQDI